MQTLAVTMGIAETNVISQFSDHLCKMAKEFVTDVEMSQPMSVTVKISSGTYGKKALIGGETILLTGAYLGKRDGVIIQGHISGMIDILEFPAKTAESVLTGYETILSTFIDTYGLTDDTSEMIAAKSKAELIETQAHEKAMLETRREDSRFGSW